LKRMVRVGAGCGPRRRVMAEFVIHGWPNCATATAGNGRISRPEWPRVPLELLYYIPSTGRKLLDLRSPPLCRPVVCPSVSLAPVIVYTHASSTHKAASAGRYILKSAGGGSQCERYIEGHYVKTNRCIK